MTAFTSSLERASDFAAASAELLAKPSLTKPHTPLGSAAETAIPASIVLYRILVHSSGVKLCLFAITNLLLFTKIGSGSSATEGVIGPKHDDGANDGNQNAVKIEAGDPGRTDGCEQGSTDNCADDAEHHVE